MADLLALSVFGVDWQLHPGRNTLEVRSINALGVGGIPSRVVVSSPGTRG